jgi:spore coat polysaccharide biosynthesis predicted glycosyltransferase SpsG
VPVVQLSPTYVAWEGYEEDMADFTATLKASESGASYFAALRCWLDENGMAIAADDFLGPHADAFITHAGMGSTVESPWFGVPTVSVPQAADQFTNAAQLEAIGAGVQLGDRPLAEAVAAALACGPRARELRETVRAGGGTGKAADAVERLLA